MLYSHVSPWIDQMGAGAIAYFATRWLAARALLALEFLFALGTDFFACVLCSQGADFRLSEPARHGACLAYLGFSSRIRAQAYSFFLTALLCCSGNSIERERERGCWFGSLFFPVWLNIHGGFVVALASGHSMLWSTGCRNVDTSCQSLGRNVLEIFLNPYGANIQAI